MKMTRKLITSVFVTMVMLVTMLVPTMAATTYSTVNGTSTSFKKYLVMDKNASVPNVTFSFTVAPGTPISAASGKMEVLAGVGTVTIAPVTFADDDATYPAVQTGDSSVTLTASQKYAKKEVTVDLSGATFDEPGIYRYLVTETNNTASGLTCDTTAKTLDVYVTDNGSGTLVVSSYVLHTGTAAPTANNTNGSADVTTTDDPVEDKIDGIQNEYGVHNLFVGKEVTGNQGSRDKYFAVKVTVSKLNAGDTLSVSLENDSENGTADGNADANSGSNSATISANASKANPTSMEANASGVAEATFYLQHGQYVAIKGLPVGSDYAVTETAEDYKSTEGAPDVTATLVSGSGTHALTDAVSGTIADSDVYTGYTNTKDGIIPTGIITKVGPAVIGAVVLVAAIIILFVKSKHDEDDEEEEEA